MGGFAFNRSALIKAIRGSHGTGSLLYLRVDRGCDLAACQVEVQRACQQADSVMPPNTISAGAVLQGVDALVIAVFWNDQDRRAVDQWVDSLLPALDVIPKLGSLRPTRLAQWPVLSGIQDQYQYFPTAFVGYQINEYPPLHTPMRGWLVDAARTHRAAENAARWMNTTPDADYWAAVSDMAPIARTDVARFLEGAARYSWNTKSVLELTSPPPRTFKTVSFIDRGQGVAQSIVPSFDWREHLADVTRFLRLRPEDLDVGFVKNAGPVASDWASLTTKVHQPVRNEIDYSNNRHLWDEYVIDAHGVQLLTHRHLEHAADLTEWRVEQIADNRFLVSARDPEAWYHHIGATGPAPELLHQARADFGDMILDWNTIAARPGPWTNIGSNVFGR